MKKKRLLALSIGITAIVVLSACGPNRLLNSAKEVEEKEPDAVEIQKKFENEYQDQIKKWEELYAVSDKSVIDAIDEYKKEKVGETINIELVQREQYTDAREMAKFVSQQLFDFSNGDLTPKQYIEFLREYGSPQLLEASLTLDEQADITLMKTIQQTITDSGVKYKTYSFSTPNVLGDQITFYRKMITTTGQTVYSVTTLYKSADGVLLFDNDDNSVPVDF